MKRRCKKKHFKSNISANAIQWCSKKLKKLGTTTTCFYCWVNGPQRGHRRMLSVSIEHNIVYQFKTKYKMDKIYFMTYHGNMYVWMLLNRLLNILCRTLIVSCQSPCENPTTNITYALLLVDGCYFPWQLLQDPGKKICFYYS